MNLALLLPIGLAALAALMLPLLVHLARRSEQKLVQFAALRWLQARPHPRRKVRFDEILLLVLRLLLLAVLALLLAEPVLFGRPDRTPWVALAPGVDASAARNDLEMDDARWHRLSPGFPAIDFEQAAHRDGESSTPPPFSSLLRELDATLPADTPLTVLVPAVLDGADAERPVLSRRVDWRIVEAADPSGTVAVTATAIPALMVRHAPEREASLRYLRAAGVAWRSSLAGSTGAQSATPLAVTVAPASTPLDAERPYLVWLVPGPLPPAVRDWVAAGGTALVDVDVTATELDGAAVAWRDEDGPLARGTRLGHGRILQLQRELLPAVMPVLLEPDFPRQLQQLLVGRPAAPARVGAEAHAPLTGASGYPERPRPLAPGLALLIALLFLVERWVANGPRRGAGA